MPRRDDIDDFPELLPDREEIRGYSEIQNSASASAARREAPIRAPQAGYVQPPVKQKSTFGIWLFCIATMGCAGYVSWWMYERVLDMEFLLDASRSELDHARKRLGELETLVVATDVNANKSGTVVQTQVKLLDDRVKEREKLVDTEIDKLWGVAYRTNKPAIEETKKAIENNSVGLKQNSEQLVAVAEQLSSQQQQVASLTEDSKVVLSGLNSQQNIQQGQQKMLASQAGSIASQTQSIQEIDNSLHSVTAKLVSTSDQLNRLQDQAKSLSSQLQQAQGATGSEGGGVNLATLKNQLDTLKGQVNLALALEQSAGLLDERLTFNERDIASFNSFRQETNRKLDQLATQIRNIQFEKQ